MEIQTIKAILLFLFPLDNKFNLLWLQLGKWLLYQDTINYLLSLHSEKSYICVFNNFFRQYAILGVGPCFISELEFVNIFKFLGTSRCLYLCEEMSMKC